MSIGAAGGTLVALSPSSLVIRCTSGTRGRSYEDSVIDYYNDLDAAMEAPMEVLDDLLGEAHEVCKLNRWCATATPRHGHLPDSPLTPPHVALLPRHTQLPTFTGF